MKHFDISFFFQHRRYEAEVAVIHGQDHIQYSISPKDHFLLMEFGTQVLHEFAGKPLEFAFPGLTEETKIYSDALAAGLRHFLGKKPA